jgi:hypothetical protein
VTSRGIALAASLWLPATSKAAQQPADDTFMPPADVKRLILCRHGQTELNRLGKIQVSSLLLPAFRKQKQPHTNTYTLKDVHFFFGICNDSPRLR